MSLYKVYRNSKSINKTYSVKERRRYMEYIMEESFKHEHDITFYKECYNKLKLK